MRTFPLSLSIIFLCIRVYVFSVLLVHHLLVIRQTWAKREKREKREKTESDIERNPMH